jgi:MATE family multidrug resistance protein
VAGAASATVAGGLVMFALFGLRSAQRFGRPVWPGREVLQSALSMGVPSALQHLGHMSAFIVMNVALARAGEVELATSQIVLHIASASFLPGAGIADAGGILVGRYLGAGRPGDADRALRSARWLALGLMGAASVAFATLGAEIASVFTKDPDVVARAGTLMLYAASFQVFDAAAMVQMAALRAVGDTRFCFLLVAGSSWLFQVPSTLLLGVVLGWGAEGAWLGLTLMVLVEAVVSGARVTRVREGRLGRLDLLLGRAA